MAIACRQTGRILRLFGVNEEHCKRLVVVKLWTEIQRRLSVDRSLSLPTSPHEAYGVIRQEATWLAGAPGDIARRVALHHGLYRDSKGNRTFPLVALHGALWAAGFFETTGRLGQALKTRYFYNGKERAYRMGLLNGFAEGFKSVNRQVFVDTYTNYFYTKCFGRDPDAPGLLQPELFQALAAMHEASRAGKSLGAEHKRQLFQTSLEFEQEVTVAPGVHEEIGKFDCPILTFLCLRPVVHFPYFPRLTYLVFRDFSDKSERIAKAVESYDLAEPLGWDIVEARMFAYALKPASTVEEPAFHETL